MATSAIRLATVRPRRGKKEARTRQQRTPRRRSRLAGWTWLASKGLCEVMAPWAISSSMDWQGRIPAVAVFVIAPLVAPRGALGKIARL